MTKKKIKDDTEFEIRFYEGILKKKPDFAEALGALGDLYTKEGMVKKGLAVDKKLECLKPADPIVLYNLACSYSLLRDTDRALKSIKKAIHCGYTDFQYIERDQDLSNLRSDIRFKRYFRRVKEKETKNVPK